MGCSMITRTVVNLGLFTEKQTAGQILPFWKKLSWEHQIDMFDFCSPDLHQMGVDKFLKRKKLGPFRQCQVFGTRTIANFTFLGPFCAKSRLPYLGSLRRPSLGHIMRDWPFLIKKKKHPDTHGVDLNFCHGLQVPQWWLRDPRLARTSWGANFYMKDVLV